MSRRATRRHDPVDEPEPDVGHSEQSTVIERVEATGAVALDTGKSTFNMDKDTR
jgi:hypothetical protein